MQFYIFSRIAGQQRELSVKTLLSGGSQRSAVNHSTEQESNSNESNIYIHNTLRLGGGFIIQKKKFKNILLHTVAQMQHYGQSKKHPLFLISCSILGHCTLSVRTQCCIYLITRAKKLKKIYTSHSENKTLSSTLQGFVRYCATVTQGFIKIK